MVFQLWNNVGGDMLVVDLVIISPPFILLVVTYKCKWKDLKDAVKRTFKTKHYREN